MKFLGISLLPIGGNKEKKTFQTLTELSKTVVKCAEKFREGVQAYSNQNIEEGEKLLFEVDEIESEADIYCFQFESKLGEGAFLPVFRGDLSRLAESIDDTADMAEESIREIHRRTKLFDDLSQAEKENEKVASIRTGLVKLAGKAVESARVLDETVSTLTENMDKAAEKAEEIHSKEKDSDDKEDELAVELHKYEELLDPISVMQVRGLIDRFGAISDAAEASGDIISAMVYALKT